MVLSHRVRGSGEGRARGFFSRRFLSLLSLSLLRNQSTTYRFELLLDANKATIGYHWLPWPSSAFYAAIHEATPNHMARHHTDHIQQHTDSHRQASSHEPRRIGAAALLQGMRLVVDETGS